MELSSLQGQLKVAIQNHQITVAKMKSDPQQNLLLQKKLHELQAEIMVLSEKQKQVVQQLRKELEKKQKQQNVNSKLGSSLAPASGGGYLTPQGSRVLVTTQHQPSTRSSFTVCTGVQSQGLSLRVEKPKSPPRFSPPPLPVQQIIQQVVPSLVSNLVAAANGNAKKGLSSSVQLFPTSNTLTTTTAKKNSSHKKGQANNENNCKRTLGTPSGTSLQQPHTSSTTTPFLVVPSPLISVRSSQTSDAQQSLVISSSNVNHNIININNSSNSAGVSLGTSSTTFTASPLSAALSFGLNLTSPIRVPQYPPPIHNRPTRTTVCVTSTVDACSNAVVSPMVSVSPSSPEYCPPPCKIAKKSNNSVCLQQLPNPAKTAISSTSVSQRNASQTNKLVSIKKELEGTTIPAPKKMSFMTALGLVNREALNEIQRKRVERKRRTTANPQFSNAALEEKRRNAAANAAAAAAIINAAPNSASLAGKSLRKPRGRPRLQQVASTAVSASTSATATSSIPVVHLQTPKCEKASPPLQRLEPPLPVSPINSPSDFESLPSSAVIPLSASLVPKLEIPTTTLIVPRPINRSTASLIHNNNNNSSAQKLSKIHLDEAVKLVSHSIPNSMTSTSSLVSGGAVVGLQTSSAPAATNKCPPAAVTTTTTTTTKMANQLLLNGCLKTMLQRNGGILTEVVLCGICHLRLGVGGGDMLACMGCKRPYHTRCAARAVPNSSNHNNQLNNNNAPWNCPKCTMTISSQIPPVAGTNTNSTCNSTIISAGQKQLSSATSSSSNNNTSSTTTATQSPALVVYPCWKKEIPDTAAMALQKNRQTKEEEKQKLLNRSRELSKERELLKEKLHRLADAAAGQIQQQVDLGSSEKMTQEALAKIENTVTLVRNTLSS